MGAAPIRDRWLCKRRPLLGMERDNSSPRSREGTNWLTLVVKPAAPLQTDPSNVSPRLRRVVHP